MNPIDAIAQKHELKPLSVDEEVWFYDLSTPIFKIRHYFFKTKGEDSLFCVSQKDDLDDALVVRFKQYLEGLSPNCLPVDGIRICEAKAIGIKDFDTVAILHGSYHNILKHDVPTVHRLIYVAFPCHHSEFIEGASESEVGFLRNKSVSTMNWNRNISSRVKLWFRNDVRKVESSKGEPLLSDSKYVFETMEDLWHDGGRMRLENYRQDSLSLAFEEDIVCFEGAFNVAAGSLIEAKNLVNDFLLN